MFIAHTSFNVLYTNNIEATHSFYQKLGVEVKKIESDKVVITF
jgi:hypothetical protein